MNEASGEEVKRIAGCAVGRVGGLEVVGNGRGFCNCYAQLLLTLRRVASAKFIKRVRVNTEQIMQTLITVICISSCVLFFR